MADAVQVAIDHFNAGRAEQAESVLRRALAGTPRDAELNGVLAGMLSSMGRHDQAGFFFQRALAGRPDEPSLRVNYGNMLLALGQAGEAKKQFEAAIALRPGESAPYTGLASALHRLMDAEGAIVAARRAVELDPLDNAAGTNLAAALNSVGNATEGLAIMRELLRRPEPTSALISSYLMTLHYSPSMTPAAIASEHRRWGAVLSGRAARSTTRLIERDGADRPLRVGFLSADLKAHVVASFIEPLWRERDRARVAYVGYQTGRADERTKQLRAMADGWVAAHDMSNDELLGRIRADRIDVLVDLSGHTEGCRPAVLAARAAPVQVTYLGYPNTTGVVNVDYRLVDALSDPVGADDLATEELVRLPRCAWCMQVPDAGAPAAERMADAEGVVLGCFNAAPKINDELLRDWAAILRAVPGSRLVLKNRALAAESVRARTAAVLEEAGVGPERVELRGWTPAGVHHLTAYQEIDIALDSYPYHGTTTTCEALWMGVPVVTRAGGSHVSRVGVSLLDAVGLGDLVAGTAADLEGIVRRLAGRVESLRAERGELRRRFEASAVCDGAGMARAFEEQLRALWLRPARVADARQGARA